MSLDFTPIHQYAAARIQQIIDTRILNAPNNEPLQESAIIEMIIRLNDLLEAANKIKRVTFSDDVNLFPGVVKDITDAVKKVRDVICHLRGDGQFIAPDGSPKKRGQKLKSGEVFYQVRFNAVWGKGILFKDSTLTMESEYDDDVCFFYGPHRLYLKRHIIRASEEAKAILGL